MNYEDAMSCGKRVARDCWRGMWVEGKTLYWVHADKEGIFKLPYKPIEAEKNANDWNILDGQK